MWPWPLIFQPKTCHFYRILGYPKVIQSYTKFWTLWDHSFLSYAADKHTNKQTNKQPETSYPRRPTVLTESAWIIIVNSWTFAILPPPQIKASDISRQFLLPAPSWHTCLLWPRYIFEGMAIGHPTTPNWPYKVYRANLGWLIHELVFLV